MEFMNLTVTPYDWCTLVSNPLFHHFTNSTAHLRIQSFDDGWDLRIQSFDDGWVLQFEGILKF